MIRSVSLLILPAGLLLAGCGQPKHLNTGYGETFQAVIDIQSDLGRPTVADAAYPLTGFEGIELRLRVTEESTDAESGELEAVQSFEVE